MLKETIKVGLEVRPITVINTDSAGWFASRQGEYLGKTGKVVEVHEKYDAIKVAFREFETKIDRVFWFHCNDLVDARTNNSKKKCLFNTQNLVGV